MSTMFDRAADGGKPVMQYIRELENKVGQLRQEVAHLRQPQRRLDLGIFILGFAAGAAAYATVWSFVLHR